MSQLHVNPESKDGISQMIFLDKDETCWVIVSHLDQNLKDTALDTFHKMFSLKPDEKSKVISFDENKDAHRWFQSYMNTPKLDTEFLKEKKCSYMFSDKGNNLEADLPEEFKPFLGALRKSHKADYNQVVANWYASAEDYLPFHSDWEYGMKCGSTVSILTINEKTGEETENKCRTFRIKPKGAFAQKSKYSAVDILTTHGSIISMGGDTQKYYRHGIPKFHELGKKYDKDAKPLSRLSLSFRHFGDF